jgi:ribonuclease HI
LPQLSGNKTYNQRDVANSQVTGFQGSLYKSFKAIGEARAYLNENRDESADNGLSAGVLNPQDPADDPNPRPGQTLAIPEMATTSATTNTLAAPSTNRGPDDSYVRRTYNVPTDAEIIYTDGACPSNGTAAGRAGIGIFYGTNDKRNISARLPGLHQTNQRAELFAVLKALEALYTNRLPGVQSNIFILTDSKYVVKALTEWAVKWERAGWKNKGNKEVVSKDLFKRARDMLRALENAKVMVTFRHIPGHSGIWGNEQADRLAVGGANMDKVVSLDWDEEYDDDELDQEIMDLQWQQEEEMQEMQEA